MTMRLYYLLLVFLYNIVVDIVDASMNLRHIFLNELNRQHKNIFLNNANDKNKVSEDPLAKCVITKNDTSAVPADLWSSTGVIQDKDEGETKQKYYPFTKYIQTRGVTFVATDNISNDFLEKVALTYQQLIPDIDIDNDDDTSSNSTFNNTNTTAPTSTRINRQAQEQMMTYMAQKRTIIPVIKTWSDVIPLFLNFQQVLTLAKENSICDAVFEYNTREDDKSKSSSSRRSCQAMDVVKNLLHYINTIGIHFLYPDGWGISFGSTLYSEMYDAIYSGYFNVYSYEDDMDYDYEEQEAVKLKVYASHVITSWMDLTDTYGNADGVSEDEWILTNPDVLQDKQPVMYNLCETQVSELLGVPSNLDEY